MNKSNSSIKNTCELSLEYAWDKNDNEGMKKDKEAISGFLRHCELLDMTAIKNKTYGTLNAYLDAYIHPKLNQLDEVVRLLKLYGIEGHQLTIPKELPTEIVGSILKKYESFWEIQQDESDK